MSDQRAAGVEPGRVARAFLEAVFAGDFESARSFCTPDLQVRVEDLQTAHGHDGLRELMDFVAEISTSVKTEIHHVLGSGDTAAINRTTILTIAGRDLTLEVGSFFTLRDGRICVWTDYQDGQAVLRAIGH